MPLTALLVAAGALALAAAALAAHPAALATPVPTPTFLALTHTVTLGYVTLLFAGTLQQLLPVLLVTELALPRMGAATLPALATGSAAVVAGFALGFQPTALAAGGALVSLALWATAVQAVLTFARARRRDAAARGLVAATLYLALTVTLGFLLAAAPHVPALARFGYPVQLHLSVGLFAAFLLGIATAGQRLLAMFALAKRTDAFRLRLLTGMVHAAVAAELLQAFAHLPLHGVAAALLVAAGALQLWEVAALLRVRLRRRLEPSVQRYLWGHAFLPLTGLLALDGSRSAAGIALLLGFVVLSASGMQAKIASFLTWQARYASRSAQGTAPLLRDLLLPGVEPVTTAGLAAGAALASAAAATGSQALAVVAAALLLVGAWAQLTQTIAILYGRHRSTAAPSASPVSPRKENA
ncbi:MAG: hypothetical protein P8Y02_01250 [Deinococcales bacterium]